jgi:hypothetical protein
MVANDFHCQRTIDNYVASEPTCLTFLTFHRRIAVAFVFLLSRLDSADGGGR